MEMSDETKRGLLVGIPLVLLVSGAIIIFIIYMLVDGGAKTRTTGAPAEITNGAPMTWRDSDKLTRNGFRVSYRFAASGKTVSGTHEKNDWYQPGEQYRVCYDPKNPADNALHSSRGSDCGKGLVF